MSNIFKKQNIMPVVVLGVICIVIAALLGGVNMLTKQKIIDAKQAAVEESLKKVMPDGSFGDSETLPKNAPESVTAVYKDKNGAGYVVTLVTYKGYEGKGIAITVGIGNDGKIINALITDNTESKDKDKSNAFPEKFIGLDASGVSGVELITGVTYSTGAIKNAINDALVVTGFASESVEKDLGTPVSAITDEEILSIAAELSGGRYEKIEAEGMPKQVLGVYKETSGNGYALHIATRTEWRPLETDGVVTVNSSGEITGVRMVEWIVGYDKEKLDKAPICEDYFINSIIGKTKDDFVLVDLVTHATNTSNNFLDPLGEALEILYPVRVYSIIGIIGVAVIVLAISACIAVPKIIKRRKNG